MHQAVNIRFVRDVFNGRSIVLPERPGVYAFWWLGERKTLLASNRHIVLKGPGERLVDVEYRDWWPQELPFPSLYVGKTTNLRKRFSLHIKRDCPGRLHQSHPGNWKASPATTSCQLRWGIEHIFPADPDPVGTIFQNVGFSYRDDFADNAIAERFFEEDRLVGTLRPWFNIDSER